VQVPLGQVRLDVHGAAVVDDEHLELVSRERLGTQ
jgi:hypothetical protein